MYLKLQLRFQNLWKNFFQMSKQQIRSIQITQGLQAIAQEKQQPDQYLKNKMKINDFYF